MRVKNHQQAPTILPDMDLGEMSHPCCMNAPKENHNEFNIVKSFAMVPPWFVCWLGGSLKAMFVIDKVFCIRTDRAESCKVSEYCNLTKLFMYKVLVMSKKINP